MAQMVQIFQTSQVRLRVKLMVHRLLPVTQLTFQAA
jgi:hypothetical protein